MEQFPLDIVVRKDEPVPRDPEMGEAVDIPPVGHLPTGFELAGFGSASSGKNKRSAKPLKFEVLKIMIVSAKISMNAVLLEKRSPLLDESPGVTMIPVGIERMMGHHDGEGCPMTLQLRNEPLVLLACFSLGEATPSFSGLLVGPSADRRKIAVERDNRCEGR